MYITTDMNRRVFLASLGVVGTAYTGGCLSTLGQSGTVSPTPASGKTTDGLTASVTSVTYDGTAGENEEAVSLSVDCADETATLSGWFSTNSCRTVAVRTLQYDRPERAANLVLYPEWTESEPPDEVDCAGASYRYSVVLTTEERLPTALQVVYERPDERPQAQFTLQNNECS